MLGSERTGLISIRTARQAGCSGGGGGGGVGPYEGETLTRRHETAPGFTIETDGANLVTWPNEGSIGLSHDWIAASGAAPLTVITEDGQRIVRLEGAQAARQRVVPSSGEFAAPVGLAFAPFWCLDVLRINATGSGVLRWARAYPSVVGNLGIAFHLDIPTSGAFKLVWQFNGNGANNIQTLPTLDGDLLAKWAILEWGYDGAAFRFRINGAEVALNNTNPAAGDAAAGQVDSWLGNGVDSGHIDYAAQFSYSVWPTDLQQGQTRAYALTTYAALLGV